MIPKSSQRRHASFVGSWLLLLAGLLAPALASGGQTDPTLVLYRAVIAPTSNGSLVRIEGEFPWVGMLQSGYPLQVVIWTLDGSPDFVRLDVKGNTAVGTSVVVVDGLTPTEASEISVLGQTATTQSLTHIGPGRIDARLTDPFPGRPLAVQLFVIDGETPFVSNPISIGAD